MFIKTFTIHFSDNRQNGFIVIGSQSYPFRPFRQSRYVIIRYLVPNLTVKSKDRNKK